MAGQTALLNEIGIDAICERIEAGESQRAIAKSLDMGIFTLNTWLNHPDRIEQSARARQESAESWLDKGLDAIESALNKQSGIDATAARAYAQECARRAALRNPRYRESTVKEHTGPGGGAVQIEAIERRIIS